MCMSASSLGTHSNGRATAIIDACAILIRNENLDPEKLHIWLE